MGKWLNKSWNAVKQFLENEIGKISSNDSGRM